MRRLSKKTKDRISNFALIAFLVLFFISLIWYIWNDKVQIQQHLQECRQICGKDEVVENLSFTGCVCKHILRPEDTI